MSSTTTDKDKIPSIYCITINYQYSDGRTEESEPKYCGQSFEHCIEAISKLLQPCKSVVPESVNEISFGVKAYTRGTYDSHGKPDIDCRDIVRFVLRYDYEGARSK